MNTHEVYLGENAGTIGYTVGKSEHTYQDHEITPEETIHQLEMALAVSVQDCAQIQLDMTNQAAMYEHKLNNMISADSGKHAPVFIKAIADAMDFMNARQDYKAYQTLEHIKTEYGDEYGFREIDPLSPEALRLG